MLRLILLILIIYIVIRIAFRLLLTESPAQKRSRVNNNQRPVSHSDTAESNDSSRFDHVEDADFEEISDEADEKKK